jgi:hypothetical protein
VRPKSPGAQLRAAPRTAGPGPSESSTSELYRLSLESIVVRLLRSAFSGGELEQGNNDELHDTFVISGLMEPLEELRNELLGKPTHVLA